MVKIVPNIISHSERTINLKNKKKCCLGKKGSVTSRDSIRSCLQVIVDFMSLVRLNMLKVNKNNDRLPAWPLWGQDLS